MTDSENSAISMRASSYASAHDHEDAKSDNYFVISPPSPAFDQSCTFNELHKAYKPESLPESLERSRSTSNMSSTSSLSSSYAMVAETFYLKNLDTGHFVTLEQMQSHPLSLILSSREADNLQIQTTPPSPSKSTIVDFDSHSKSKSSKFDQLKKRANSLLNFATHHQQNNNESSRISSCSNIAVTQTTQDKSPSSSTKELRERGESVVCRVKTIDKSLCEFANLKLVQKLAENNTDSAVWSMRFSINGTYLATGGKDSILKIWKKNSENCFGSEMMTVLLPSPIRLYSEHESDILDLSWSKNDFLISASMDRTVRLWHPAREKCLSTFKHPDFVTSVCFHPKDVRYFVSGCLDCRIRIWNIPDKRVEYWTELPQGHFVTSVCFSCDGKYSIVGSSAGIVFVYVTEGLKLDSQIKVKSNKGKNAKGGKKITGIVPIPTTVKTSTGEQQQQQQQQLLLVTSNDSRVRIYNMKNGNLLWKYKGNLNRSSQIKASLSEDCEYIIAGSEDKNIVIWSKDGHYSSKGKINYSKQSKAAVEFFLGKKKHERIHSCEIIEAHSSIVTVAMFVPSIVFAAATTSPPLSPPSPSSNEFSKSPLLLQFPNASSMIISADYQGQILLFYNEQK